MPVLVQGPSPTRPHTPSPRETLTTTYGQLLSKLAGTLRPTTHHDHEPELLTSNFAAALTENPLGQGSTR
ncbi:hypothetical protein FAGKG844_1020003 [Frankia sp. AgKG'84/4]